MPHIKKLVLRGFKSFAKETEIPFSNGMNVIVGPNGSGKSNLADAICFVLGRLSIKSMRAAKSANLIFAGTKEVKPSGEASVKLVFDNSDKKFNFDKNEVFIERVVRGNGQSIYKINEDVKTRQEVLELLANTGIDPYGFNIVLQGEIGSTIRMQSEERRKIIEEVAGISIYESRKEKSLKELEKTDEKLKEISAILRERKAYLKNLEEERKQALKFKQLEEAAKNYKASILTKKIEEKDKEIEKVKKEIDKILQTRDKLKAEMEKLNKVVMEMEEEVNKINSIVQGSSGIGQEKLTSEISDLRAGLAGLNVKNESNDTRLSEVLKRRERAEIEIKNLEDEIKDLRKKSPLQEKKFKEIEKKKVRLDEFEKGKKDFYRLKEKLNAVRERISDKEDFSKKIKNELDFILGESDKIAKELSYKNIETCKKAVSDMKNKNEIFLEDLKRLEKQIKEIEKNISVCESEISRYQEVKDNVSKLDLCPLCKTKITKEHIHHISEDSNKKISELKNKMKYLSEEFEKNNIEIRKTREQQDKLRQEISKAEIDFVKLENLEEKKERIKKLAVEEKILDNEIKELTKTRENFESKVSETKNVEEEYDKTIIEIQELSAFSYDNINSELEFKEREIEKTKLIIKQSYRDEEDLEYEIKEIEKDIEEKNSLLGDKEEKLKEIMKKFEKMIEKREKIQKELRGKNSSSQELQIKMREHENNINDFKIDKAKLDAEKESLETDFGIYEDTQTISLPVNVLENKLENIQKILEGIGSVNLRALEVYDSVKNEYDAVAEKVSTLEKEKEQILQVINEIDKKKKKTFMKTLIAINELFNRNFMQLSTKGEVFLELENEEDPFSGGLDVTVKVGKGKYFDVHGLSGGEQTLVALSLIFAIQEYKPYFFYIFDEVDAALDKRNSEKLALLIKRYMKSGQYIIVTHNDALITESTFLYGVSMQDGVSKILSLEV